jgi:hypothetical protein
MTEAGIGKRSKPSCPRLNRRRIAEQSSAYLVQNRSVRPVNHHAHIQNN